MSELHVTDSQVTYRYWLSCGLATRNSESRYFIQFLLLSCFIDKNIVILLSIVVYRALWRFQWLKILLVLNNNNNNNSSNWLILLFNP